MRILIILIFSLSIVHSSVTFAAQSTADNPVTPELKNSLLNEVLGPRFEQLQREDEYVIGHGDILTVSIYEEGDMTVPSDPGQQRSGQSEDAPRLAHSGTQVMMDGRISLINIGDIEVIGLTLAELADYLKKLYAVIHDDPIVTTTLVQSNSLRYTVMGEVLKPGIFFLDYPLTLVQIVARSGGFSEWASKKITVVRKQLQTTDEALFEENTLEFDYDDFVSGKNLEKNIYIRSKDIVIID